MIYRLKIALLGLVMLVLFLLVIAGGVIACLVFLLGYVLTGSDWLRSRVTSFGRALDQGANVPFMDGHEKEPISSHVGRFYEAKYGNAYKSRPPTIPDLVIPWQAKFVRWLTDLAEVDHVYKSVEDWAVEKGLPL